jgi:carbon-monoxide dehydrogenase large subunit
MDRAALIGAPQLRNEDARLLTGRGRFSDDFTMPGQTYAVMVRSPHAHARLKAIDTKRARQMPGVLGVFTGADCTADGLQPIQHSPVPSNRYDLKLTGPNGDTIFFGPHVLLPADKARHVGEAVAMVVAETKAQAEDAAEAVEVDYEPLPFVADTSLAASGKAPAVWDEVPSNTCVDATFGSDPLLVEVAFVHAAHIVTRTYPIGRVAGTPIEPRAALAAYDTTTGKYMLYAGSGGAFRQRREIADVLGIDPKLLRVLSFDVGGNFGVKNRLYVEYALVVWAAKKVGRPVKFTATRSETLVSDYQGRDLLSRVSLALDKDGRFLALRADNISNIGARAVSFSPLGKGSALVSGNYDIPLASVRSRAVFTHTVPTQAYRSSGRPEVTYAIERLIDAAAEELGFDRLELRRRNLIQEKQFPFYMNPFGMRYDSGRYDQNMDLVLKLSDWSGFVQRKRAAEARRRLLGLGFANYVESSIGTAREQTTLTVSADGIEVVIGTQAAGQGHETSFAQVAAAKLQLPFDKVHIRQGDTDTMSFGGGTHSGRSMRMAGTVITYAAAELIEKGKELAAAKLEAGSSDIAYDNGRFAIVGTDRSVGLFDLGPFAVTRDNEMHDPVFPNGAQVCEVEVDPETGGVQITRYTAVDDVGIAINPLIVEGQTHGGIVTGVGQALMEACVVDPETGQTLSGTFMDYAVPRADTVPPFATQLNQVASPTNPLGVKAGGEGGTTPAPAVVASAIADALRPLGVKDIPMPASPLAIWRAIQKAKEAN